MERSHRIDDEEFYRPYLLQAQDVGQFLRLSTRWLCVYNVLRPHTGIGMDNQPPLAVLRRLGYTGDDRVALFPPVILDDISADLVLSCDPETGNDLLAHYTIRVRPISHAASGSPRGGRGPQPTLVSWGEKDLRWRPKVATAKPSIFCSLPSADCHSAAG